MNKICQDSKLIQRLDNGWKTKETWFHSS